MFNPTFVGRMVADPVLRSVEITNNEGVKVKTPVCNIRVAVDDGFRKDAEGNKIGTEFYDCAFFRGAAETICKYGAKGRVIAIAGTVHTRTWFNRETGEKYFTLTVPNVEKYEFFGPSSSAQKEQEEETNAADIVMTAEETPVTRRRVARNGGNGGAVVNPAPDTNPVDPDPNDVPW